jgi:hypothetical protein
MLTKQILCLLVLNSFFAESNDPSGGEYVSSGSVNYAGNASSELLSNQLSNWLSQINNDFDIGVNYRPGTKKVESREVELALSTQLLNDRLSLNGSLDMKSNVVAENTSKLLGDFDADYKLNKRGNIRLRAYNHSNSDKLMYNSEYTQGVGVLFMEEFNTISELFNRYWAFLTGKRKKKNPPQVDAVSR